MTKQPAPTPQQMLSDLLSHILTGYFGTKNRAELLQRVEAIKEAIPTQEEVKIVIKKAIRLMFGRILMTSDEELDKLEKELKL